jgi:hypothetical protein
MNENGEVRPEGGICEMSSDIPKLSEIPNPAMRGEE